MDVDIRRPKIEDKDELHRFFKDVIMDTFSKEGIAHLTKDIVEEIETKRVIYNLILQVQARTDIFYLPPMKTQLLEPSSMVL